MVTVAHRCLSALHPNTTIATPARLLYTSNICTIRRIFSLRLIQSGQPLYFSTASVKPRARSMGADVVTSPVAPSSDQVKCTIIKSPSDDREYELVHLPNGLCALLIHDPKISDEDGSYAGVAEEDDSDEECDEGESDDDEDDDEEDDEEDTEDDEECVDCLKNGACDLHNDDMSENGSSRDQDFVSTKRTAAAALCVEVGSFADPKDAQGLFHFLEHMLFMGSSKFPDENEYDSFLSKHGGSSNAYTDTEHTCFFFDVNHKFLKPALERFSQFFISPLIKEDAMEREVQAVDSEFEGHLQSDSVRLSQLQCNTAHELHPFNCFSWGNRKSLSEPMKRGVNMRSKLLEMYERYYHAGRMKLAVISGEPLETLKGWVTELFSEIRPGLGSPLQFEWKGQVWQPGKMYWVKSVKDQHCVSIIWPFPCLKDVYLKKPYDYLSHLVGHEGAGSLFSVLKRNGWATHLSAGVGEGGFERSSAGYMFNVNIYLTDSGLGQVEEVVGLLYQYLKMLRKEGPQEWVYKELQAMTNMEFQFVEEAHPDDYVVSLATNMHLFPPSHVIYGDYALEMWDPELIRSLLSLMVPANMRLDIVSSSFDEKDADIQREPWFDFPYKVKNISPKLMELWEDPPGINTMLHMPVANEFIPKDFSIRNVESVDMECPPRVIVDDAFLKVWYKLDKKFLMPRANTYFRISCQGILDSVKGYVLTELYVKLIKDALNESLYLASVARLETDITFSGDKLEIQLRGFNEKLPCLASKIAHFVKEFVPSAERFEVKKEELMRAYTNLNIKPSKHSTYLRIQILKEQFFAVDDKKTILATLRIDDLLSFVPLLLSKIYVEAFCHGNLLEDEALAIANVFKDCLALEPLPNGGEPREKILRLPQCKNLIYETDTINPFEENSAVEMYFQINQDCGEKSVRDRALYDLFEAIVSEPFFNELRTKEQLGYTVSCSARLTFRVLGFCFRVVSAKYPPAYVAGRIDYFIDNFGKHLEALTPEEFTNHVDALIEVKLESDHNLREETDRLWLQIVEKRYLFDIQKREAEELRKLSLHDIMHWYNHHLSPSSRYFSKLIVNVWGSNAQAEKGSKAALKPDIDVVIEDVTEFKSKSEYFPALC